MGEGGGYISLGTSLPYYDFRQISLSMNCFFCVCPILFSAA